MALGSWLYVYSIFSVYASSNEREFFCEAFELYIRDPIALATVSPETYNEIVSDLVSLINN